MPNRVIKDSIRTSKKVDELSDFQFRVWVSLITYVDDFGRGSADMDLLPGILFPRNRSIDSKQIAEAFQVLQSLDMITLYEVDGEQFFYFTNWDEHQTVRAKKSKFPEPCEHLQANECNCKQTQADASICSRNPIQSNPIQIESESESESEYEYNPNPNPNTESNPNTLSPLDTFCSEYPSVVNQEAKRVWESMNLDSEINDIMDGLRKWKASEQWEDKRYIPYAENFLAKQRWKSPPAQTDRLSHLREMYRAEMEKKNGQG